MRLFIGIELSDEIKNYISDFVQPLQMMPKGWENPHDYHLTLLFLGETSEDKAYEIIKRLEDISFKPFEIELNIFNFFPRRVLFLGISESIELLELKNVIEKIFPEWIKPEMKEFVPHITVKRWQRYEYNFLEAAIKSFPFLPLKIDVSAIALFKSEKDLKNNKYHVIYRIEFNQERAINGLDHICSENNCN
jgi:2'-5' RNA ligase